MGRYNRLDRRLAVTGPAQLPCLPLRFHVAQKLPGMTLPPRSGKQNERFRDLVDLLLMDTMITHDYVALRAACELVFRNRNTHAWPPDLSTVPAHWERRLPVSQRNSSWSRQTSKRPFSACATSSRASSAPPRRTPAQHPCGTPLSSLACNVEQRRGPKRGSRTGSRQRFASTAPCSRRGRPPRCRRHRRPEPASWRRSR